jgi:hypothetical protein
VLFSIINPALFEVFVPQQTEVDPTLGHFPVDILDPELCVSQVESG